MTRFQVLVAFLLGYLLLTAGVVWKFGDYGLMGAGVALIGSLFLVNVKE